MPQYSILTLPSTFRSFSSYHTQEYLYVVLVSLGKTYPLQMHMDCVSKNDIHNCLETFFGDRYTIIFFRILALNKRLS